MIRHVVMWRVRGETVAERQAESRTVMAAFETLRGHIPGMRRLEVGLAALGCEDMCDVVLIADFDSLAALKAYAVNPKHLHIRDQLTGTRISRHSIDFEFDVG